jgi:hypothetical protein
MALLRTQGDARLLPTFWAEIAFYVRYLRHWDPSARSYSASSGALGNRLVRERLLGEVSVGSEEMGIDLLVAMVIPGRSVDFHFLKRQGGRDTGVQA